MRSATASAWDRPLSDRLSPRAWPGRTLPVVGVSPWRTRSSSVGRGGRRVGMSRSIANLPALPWRYGLGRGWGPRLGEEAGVGAPAGKEDMDSLRRLTAEIVECQKCPRLVAWREQVGREKRAAFRDEDYWARPLPGFGDPAATLLVVGLAPAAHGGNRTGRIFTGDRSGDWRFGA